MATSQWTELANRYGAQYAVPSGLILALIDMESGGDPNDVNPNSNATGLMQVTRTVLIDYNKRHNLSLTLEDVKDPETNIRIGVELLRRIALTYEKHNGMKPQWSNSAYVGLIVLGWNAGYSRKSGVSYVLARMAAAGIPKTNWNVRSVQESAQRLENASVWIKTRSLAWVYKVVELYNKIVNRANKRVAKEERKAERRANGTEWSTGK